jgi:hypothetical protein
VLVDWIGSRLDHRSVLRAKPPPSQPAIIPTFHSQHLFLSLTLRRGVLLEIQLDMKDFVLLWRTCPHCLTVLARFRNLHCPPLDWATWKDLFRFPTLLTVSIMAKSIACRLFHSDGFNLAPFLNVTAFSF